MNHLSPVSNVSESQYGTRMDRLIKLLLAFLALSVNTVAYANSPERINVFYLNSYHVGYPWSDNMTRGIREVLNNSGRTIQLQIEFLNSKKYYDKVIKQNLYQHFAYKFRNKTFDIVIVSDNNALDFILEYGDALFPGLPIVFCGINDYAKYNIDPGRQITGVIESIFFKENLDIARGLHPEVKKLIVIGNNSVTSIAIADQIKESIRVNNIDFDIRFRNDLRSETLIEELQHEAGDTMLYIIPAYEEINGEFYSSWELTRKVFEATGLPVFGAWEFLVGYGTVGGKVNSAHVHGKTAARLALRILDGEEAASIPYIARGGHKYIFDYKILQHFKIASSQLPEGSIIINQPYNFYQLNRVVFWFIVTSVVLLLVVVVLLIFNTNQRKKANLEMKASRLKLRMFLDNIPQLVFWQDKDLRFMDVNQSFLEFFRIRDYDDIIGSNNYDHLGVGIDVDRVMETNHEVMRSEKPQYKIRWTIRRSDQEVIWLEVNKIPFHDENGEVVGVLSTAEDITKEMNLEKQLRQSQKMEALGILSGGIAHDFNNILTSIVNSAELALEDIPIGSVTRKDLKRILNASARGSNLVKQIMAFSRPSSQKFKPFNVVNTVNESLDLIRSSLPKQIVIKEDITSTTTFCMGDPTQIHQIVMNLCTNSFQAMGESNGCINISLQECFLGGNSADQLSVEPGAYIELVIADDGPGIRSDILEKIFDPFFSTKNKDIGTGLGLSVVHGIIQAHKGGISVTSIPNVRTEFRVYIPQLSEKLNDFTSVDFSLHFGSESILFVEDGEDQRISVPRALQNLGYRVEAAANAEEALLKFNGSGSGFDLVITDYDMPKVNGFEFAAMLEEISPETPIIMVSGRQFEFDELRHRNIKKLVTKPYNKISISEAIRCVMKAANVNNAPNRSAS